MIPLKPSFKSTMLSIISIFIACLLIFSYFFFTTESRYKSFPLGDAVYYTLMAVHYNNPSGMNIKMPTIYANRFLPSLIVGLFVSRYTAECRARAISFSDKGFLKSFREANTIVRHGYVVLNFLSNFLTVLLIYLSFRHLGFSNILSTAFPILFMSFFIPVRLYICWPQMADPLGFLFLAALCLFLLKGQLYLYIIFAFISVTVREDTLLLIPAFWVLIMLRKMPFKRKAFFLFLSILPVSFFFYLRAHPYFPAEIQPSLTQFEFNVNRPLPKYIFEYIRIFLYHYTKTTHFSMYKQLAIMPFYVFGALTFIILKEWKAARSFLKKHKYFMPFLIACFFIGISIDRHFFYLFPIVFFMMGYILDKNITGNKRLLLFILILFSLNFWLYGAYIPVKESNILFCDLRQLEYIYTQAGIRYVIYRVLIAGVIGMASYLVLKDRKRGVRRDV